MAFRFFIGALLLIFVHGVVVAEDPSSGGFFDKDFSKSPLTKDQGSELPSGKPAKQPKSGVAKPVSTPTSVASPTNADFDNRKKVKVDSIGLLLNAVKREHVQARLKELLSVVHEFDMGIGSVIFIGGFPGAEGFAVSTAIVARGGEIKVLGSVPYRYKVTKAPTWILKTEEGEILLEGTGPLRENFDKEGNFVYPEAAPGVESVVEVSPSPTPEDAVAKIKAAVDAAKQEAEAVQGESK